MEQQNAKMNILYFAVGNSTVVHMQAQYALRTTYARTDPKLIDIYILTDSPALYADLPFVHVETISPKEIQEWKGKYNYFFRVKINAIRRFINSHDDKHLMFLDSDTYIFNDITNLIKSLDKGIGIMHKDEGDISKSKGVSLELWQHTKGREYGGILISNRYHMFNSGVFAIPQPYLHDVIDKSLTICDDFLADGVTSFNLEQYGDTIALYESTNSIEEAYKYIGHYWHHKEVWTQHIATFFIRSHMSGRTLNEELEIIKKKNFPLSAFLLNIKRIYRKRILKPLSNLMP